MTEISTKSNQDDGLMENNKKFVFQIPIVVIGSFIIFLLISAYDAWNLRYKRVQNLTLNGDIYFEEPNVDATAILNTNLKPIQSILHSLVLKGSVCQYSYLNENSHAEVLGSVSIHMTSSSLSASVVSLEFHLSQIQVFRKLAWDIYDNKINHKSFIGFHCSSNVTFYAWGSIPIHMKDIQNSFSIEMASYLGRPLNQAKQTTDSAQKYPSVNDFFSNLNISRNVINWENVKFTFQKHFSSDIVKIFSPFTYLKVHTPELRYEIAREHSSDEYKYKILLSSFTFDIAAAQPSITADFSLTCMHGSRDKPCSLMMPLIRSPQTLLDFENFEHVNITAISHDRNFLTCLIGPIHWADFSKKVNTTNEQSVQHFHHLASQTHRPPSFLLDENASPLFSRCVVVLPPAICTLHSFCLSNFKSILNFHSTYFIFKRTNPNDSQFWQLYYGER